jgi:hypothetical protein
LVVHLEEPGSSQAQSSRLQSSRFEVPDRFNLDQPVAKQDLISRTQPCSGVCRLVSGLIRQTFLPEPKGSKYEARKYL